MACTARSSRPRSCETTSAAPGKRASQCFQPQRRFQVEVVGRLVEQQQVGVGEQRGGQRDAHAPAAGELLHRARLRRLVEAEAGEDGGGARGGRVGADGAQPFVDFGQPVRVGGVGFGAAGRGARGRLAARCRAAMPGPTALPARTVASRARAARRMSPPSSAMFAGDGAQQRGFAGAVAADQADAPAGIDREVGAVQQRAAAQADDRGGDGQKGHGAPSNRGAGDGGQVMAMQKGGHGRVAAPAMPPRTMPPASASRRRD